MSKGNRKRKGKSNEEVLKSVLGEKYVSQYSATSDELKAKQGSDVTRAPTKKKISVMPVSFPNDETSSVPQPTLSEPIEKTSITSQLPIKEEISDVHPVVSSPQVSIKPQKTTSKVPMPVGISRNKIKELLRVLKRFPSCDELRLDFSNEQFVIKKNGMYHVITFEGEKILSYTFNGRYIDVK